MSGRIVGGCDAGLRGQAAEDREHYVLSTQERQTANSVVHCRNDSSSCPTGATYADMNVGANNNVKSSWNGRH